MTQVAAGKIVGAVHLAVQLLFDSVRARAIPNCLASACIKRLLFRHGRQPCGQDSGVGQICRCARIRTHSRCTGIGTNTLGRGRCAVSGFAATTAGLQQRGRNEHGAGAKTGETGGTRCACIFMAALPRIDQTCAELLISNRAQSQSRTGLKSTALGNPPATHRQQLGITGSAAALSRCA